MIIIYFDKNLKKVKENQNNFIEIRETFYGNEIYGVDTFNKFKYLLSLFGKSNENYYIVSSGSDAEEFLNSEYVEEKRIIDFIIYCFNKEKYLPLMKKYSFISMIENKSFSNVINQIKLSLPKSHPDEILKHCSSFLLQREYYGQPMEVHRKLFENFDENYVTPSFNENIKTRMIDLLRKIAQTESDFKKAEKIIENINNEVDFINCYTAESIIVYFLNKCLREVDSKCIEFAGLLNYALYKYYFDNQKINITKDMTFYRKMVMSIKDLYSYDQFEGDIICYPSFVSTSIDPNSFKFPKTHNKRLSGCNKEFTKEKSVLLKIYYTYDKSNYCPAFDIKYISKFKGEKEYLFPPFSFFRIKKFISDEGTSSNPVIVELEVIPKKENLIGYLKNGGKIIYIKEKRCMGREN